MEEYSDGSSSSEDEDGDDGAAGGGGGGKGEGKGKLVDQQSGWAERRTSARRQKQVEIHEADVAAAREDNIEVRGTAVVGVSHVGPAGRLVRVVVVVVGSGVVLF